VRCIIALPLTLSAVLLAAAARADPPALRERGSLREGLVVEGCRGPRCDPWVRFPPRPYRAFIDARMSPSGRFFYVWTRPDGGSREVDVFATPTREAQLANRRGHWSPGAGGALDWVAGDRLWHAWRCGSDCGVAQLYSVTGATLLSLTGEDVERSRDGRYAVVATRSEGVLVDLARATLRPYRGPAGFRYDNGSLAWADDHAALTFEETDLKEIPETRTLHIPLPGAVPTTAVPTRPTVGVAPEHPVAPARVATPARIAAPARRPALRAALRATRPSR